MNSFIKNLLQSNQPMGSLALDAYERDLQITGIFQRHIYESVELLSEGVDPGKIYKDMLQSLLERSSLEGDRDLLTHLLSDEMVNHRLEETSWRTMCRAVLEFHLQEQDKCYFFVALGSMPGSAVRLGVVLVRNGNVEQIAMCA